MTQTPLNLSQSVHSLYILYIINCFTNLKKKAFLNQFDMMMNSITQWLLQFLVTGHSCQLEQEATE